MTAFLVSVVVIQCVLLFAMYATVSHLLVRIRSVERVVAEVVNPFAGTLPLVLGDPLPDQVSRELGPLGDVVLHVSSAGCAGCVAHLESLGRTATDHDIVVMASADDFAAVELSGEIRRAVSPALIHVVRAQQLALPVTVELVDGTVSDVRRPPVGPPTPAGDDSRGSRR